MTGVANPASELGYDAYVAEDLDASGRSSSDEELYENAILHRLMEERLPQIGSPDDGFVDYGLNVRAWVHEALTPESIARKAPFIDEVIRRDERTATLSVTLALAAGETFADASRVTFTITIRATTVTGVQIERVVGVSDVTVAFLAQGR